MPNAAGSEEANPPPPQIAAPAPLPAAKAATCSCAVPIAHHAKRRKPKEKMPQGPEPPPPEARPEPNAVVDAEVGEVNTSLTSILGKDVKSPKGEDLGRIVDVLADPDGRVRVAIIDFGGFLGVGNRRIAVDWPLLHFNPDAKDKSLVLSVTREKLQSTPEYKDPLSPRVLMPPAVPSHDPDPGQATK
jgi:PRC-barrel domain